MSRFYGELETFSVDVLHEMELQLESENEGDAKEGQSYSDQRRFAFERPNRLAVTASGASEGKVVCDGQQMLAYLPSLSRYLLVDAPETLAEMMHEEAALLLGAGRTVVQLAAGDTYDEFMESASKVVLLEPEQFEKVECDRIELTRENSIILLWIEQGDRPLLRKMQLEMQLDVAGTDFGATSQVVKFSNWEVNQPIPDETFAIEEPENAEQVATLMTQGRSDEVPHPLVGAEAPDCELPLLEGGHQKLSEIEGKKVVVLDFWALWCAPCLEALPSIDKVATKFADHDVAFFAVNLGDETEEIRKYLDQHELKLPISIDPKSELSELFHAESIPMTVIVDKQGVVQVVHVGFGSSLEQTLSDEIEAVLEGEQLAEETLRAAREASRWGEPIPVGEDAVTAKDATNNVLAFNLRTSVEAYKKFGSRDPEWDDAAIEFLTEAARHFSSASWVQDANGTHRDGRASC